MYEDLYRTPSCIRWLDCSKKEAGPAPDREAIQIQNENIYDMCIVTNGGKQLLVTVDPESSGKRAINAYNIESGKLQWTLSGRFGNMKCKMCPRSICTDNNENIFVLDEKNNCIVIVSVNGKYIDLVMQGDKVICEADWIRWTEGNNFIVNHSDTRNNQYISIFKFDSGN